MQPSDLSFSLFSPFFLICSNIWQFFKALNDQTSNYYLAFPQLNGFDLTANLQILSHFFELIKSQPTFHSIFGYKKTDQYKSYKIAQIIAQNDLITMSARY